MQRVLLRLQQTCTAQVQSRMKAIRINEQGGPEVLRLEEGVAIPSLAEPTDVRVKVAASGVNPVDTYIRSGANNYRPALPYTPGKDGAGVVEAVGDKVTKVRVGDRVYLGGSKTGTAAEFTIASQEDVHPLPANTTFAQGASLGIPYGTAYRALFHKARAIPGEWVLVHGASGGVGLATVQLARMVGLKVIGSASTAEGKELVQKQGAHFVVDHSDATHLDQVLSLTNGAGVDIIVEMLANVNLGRDLPALARGGRVVIVGSRGTVEINPRDAMAREAIIVGCQLYQATPAENAAAHAHIRAGLEAGTLNPVVAEEVPFGEGPKAHELVMRPGQRGNIVISVASHL
eukprot:TRINITY_DN6331_c0_g1_i1.p1 TRINITY_DN6331_c0_g1~~TRINITY_DN6331_c0_g1_i1.p1  ORF type:complete len:346 (+),score=55.03 TRINITY_DN6331_c0_g1_i1:39-1076(+)